MPTFISNIYFYKYHNKSHGKNWGIEPRSLAKHKTWLGLSQYVEEYYLPEKENRNKPTKQNCNLFLNISRRNVQKMRTSETANLKHNVICLPPAVESVQSSSSQKMLTYVHTFKLREEKNNWRFCIFFGSSLILLSIQQLEKCISVERMLTSILTMPFHYSVCANRNTDERFCLHLSWAVTGQD